MLATLDHGDLETIIRTLQRSPAGPGDTGPPDHHGGKLMTTQRLPGTDAARHGTGDADLTIMIAAHDAFRRDLTRLARAAAAADLSDPARRQSVAAGWDLFKRELHMHHTAEDQIIWPVLRPRLAYSEAALSVLDAMEEEHQRIDPLLAAVDAAFAQHGVASGGAGVMPGHGPVAVMPGGAGATPGTARGVSRDGPGEDRLAEVIDVLTSTLTGHLAHEERDGLPLIGVALTAAEWRSAGFKIARKNGLSAGGEMFAWILDGAGGQDAGATLGQLPPPLRLLYRAVWKPRFDKTPRW
jgi:Hemerythrin HHE cation binding domain